jgi:hypothetical protein
MHAQARADVDKPTNALDRRPIETRDLSLSQSLIELGCLATCRLLCREAISNLCVCVCVSWLVADWLTGILVCELAVCVCVMADAASCLWCVCVCVWRVCQCASVPVQSKTSDSRRTRKRWFQIAWGKTGTFLWQRENDPECGDTPAGACIVHLLNSKSKSQWGLQFLLSVAGCW